MFSQSIIDVAVVCYLCTQHPLCSGLFLSCHQWYGNLLATTNSCWQSHKAASLHQIHWCVCH